MRLNFTSIIIAAILAEILGILSLVIALVIVSPGGDEAQVRELASRLGFYVGPVSGFVFCLVGGFWTARRARTSFLANGLAMGGAAAILDITIAILLGAQFQWILLISNAGRIIAGALGSFLAEKRHG